MNNRPSKCEIFMSMAWVLSKLSRDSQTKHGCIITDKKHHILGCGYNDMPRGMLNDETVPTTRPDKYNFFIHAERNAVSFCEHRPVGGTAYVTGKSCTDCIMHLWQNGVDTVYMLDRMSSMLDDKQATIFEDFTNRTPGLKTFIVKPDLSFLLSIPHELGMLGFIHSELEDETIKLSEIFLGSGLPNGSL